MKRATFRALLEAQSLALVAILALSMAAMAVIWHFVGSARDANAAAVAHEHAVNHLHIMLRGLNEAAVSTRSGASVELVHRGRAAFAAALDGLPDASQWREPWEGIEQAANRLAEGGTGSTFDDEALILLGRTSARAEKLIASLSAGARDRRDRARHAEQVTRTVIALAAVLLAAGVAGIFFAVHRNVNVPLEAAIGFAHRVASGDLTACERARRRGQAARLLEALVRMNTDLARIVREVRGGTTHIEAAVGDLADADQDLSRRTAAEAAALEQTASSLEEITAAVARNVENTRHAAARASEARELAARGDEAISSFAQRMGAIEASARRMSDIIGVIDAIAFQTNILALNAAIEAARAGDHGRGFAVVAAEVRALSQRVAEAAREIKALIEGSSADVARGGAMLQASRDAMNRLSAAIEEVTRLIGEVSEASGQQAAGIKQVNGAVHQIDHTVQQNAALVEQMAAAACSLRGDATELRHAVEVFKLAAGDASLAERPVPAGG